VTRKRGGRGGAEAPDAGPWLDPAEARPKLLLFAAGGIDLDGLAATGAVAALVLPTAEANEPVREACRRLRLPLLLRGDLAAASDLAADGVHLAKAEQVTAARERLGRDSLVGVSCGRSRHEAVVAGEASADYVLFGSLDVGPTAEILDLVGWWSELFVLPCGAAGRFAARTAAAAAASGASFLATREADVELAEALLQIGST
jgi:thiamine-phosphate pyrophosphorylase